jgi:endoglucanase
VFRSFSLRVSSMIIATATACDPGSTVTETKRPPVPASTSGCQSDEVRVGTQCLAIPDIKLNTVGYLVGRTKRATARAIEGVDTFVVATADTDEAVYAGTLALATDNADTADFTRVADFTDFDVEGTYVLKIDGLSVSPPFQIGQDVMNEPLRLTMLGLYGQRCGVPVGFSYLGETFEHAACHLHDALRDGDVADGKGGWHDAGDYGKYTVNAAFSLALILKAWEDFGSRLQSFAHIPDYTGELPHWLAEAKFQLDQILKMQLADGSAVHMIGPYNATSDAGRATFPGMISPEADTGVRAFSGASTTATADLAAVTALAARVFRPFDAEYADKCLAAALAAMAYLGQVPETVWPSLTRFTHDAYETSSADSDDRFWALVELWRTTSDPSLLVQVEASLRTHVSTNFDWGSVDNLGMFSYVQATSSARDPSKLASAQQSILQSADELVGGATRNAYGRALDQMYYWGINGVLARSVVTLNVANTISPKAEYMNAAVQQIDHLLGRNAFGRSFVTGLGYLPPMYPHHRPSAADGEAWPGLLVGGPNPGSDDDPIKAKRATGLAPGLVWFDESGSYSTNEIAINWNASLAYALAWFYR